MRLNIIKTCYNKVDTFYPNCTQTVPYIKISTQTVPMTKTRDQYIKVYLTDDEKSKVTQKADQKNCSTSTLARQEILQNNEGEQA